MLAYHNQTETMEMCHVSYVERPHAFMRFQLAGYGIDEITETKEYDGNGYRFTATRKIA